MDWTLCIVCQNATHEQLKCPLNSERPGDKSEAYLSFLGECQKLDQLPVSLKKFGQDVDVDH